MEATHGMYLTLRGILPRIDNTEANQDGAIGELPGESHSTTDFGKSIREFTLLRIDVFGSELITHLRPMLWVGPVKERVARERRTVKTTGRRKIISLGGKPIMTVKMRVRVGSRLLVTGH